MDTSKDIRGEIDKILDKAFWDVCLQSHTDVAAGYSYNHRHGLEETKKALVQVFKKYIEKCEMDTNVGNYKGKLLEGLEKENGK